MLERRSGALYHLRAVQREVRRNLAVDDDLQILLRWDRERARLRVGVHDRFVRGGVLIAVAEKVLRADANDARDAQLRDWIELVHDQALLAEGSPVNDPAKLVQRMTTLLSDAVKRAATA